jgi:Ran GTPase-activating protein (RanGAP) involved in mRNA processing and transport
LDLVNTCLEDGFFPLFEYLKTNTSLERIYLSGNHLNVQHCESLSGMLELNQTLKALFLSTNPIGDSGAIALSAGLVKNSTLEELSLASCGIKEKGFNEIFEALFYNPKLIQLDLGYSNSTRVLNSMPNEINDLTAEKLIDFLQKSPNLKFVNLIKTGLSLKLKENILALKDKIILIDGSINQNKFPQNQDAKAIKSVYR